MLCRPLAPEVQEAPADVQDVEHPAAAVEDVQHGVVDWRDYRMVKKSCNSTFARGLGFIIMRTIV